jgi:hypothetical protein
VLPPRGRRPKISPAMPSAVRVISRGVEATTGSEPVNEGTRGKRAATSIGSGECCLEHGSERPPRRTLILANGVLGAVETPSPVTAFSYLFEVRDAFRRQAPRSAPDSSAGFYCSVEYQSRS